MFADTEFPWNFADNEKRFEELKVDKKIIEIYDTLVTNYSSYKKEAKETQERKAKKT